MELRRGQGVSGGVCAGRLLFWERESREVKRRKVENIEEELERLGRAFAKAGEELEQLAGRHTEAAQPPDGVCSEVDWQYDSENAQRAVFAAQKILLEDVGFGDLVRRAVTVEHQNAEYAVDFWGQRLAKQLLQTEDAYVRLRAQDMQDITERLLRCLAEGEATRMTELDPTLATGKNKTADAEGETAAAEQYILMAEELFSGELMQLDRSRVTGLVLQSGSPCSHTAILARGMGLPMLILEGEAKQEAWSGRMAFMDGAAGELWIEPDEGLTGELERRCVEEKQRRERLEKLKGKEDVTGSGQRMRVFANAASVQDVIRAAENDAAGIGLFRSELLYLERDEEPDEELLTDTYRQIVECMAGKEVIIRTFDIGADKKARWLRTDREENPALGLRAIRLGLVYPRLLRTQLKALFRAARYGRLSILYPMINSVDELLRLKELEKEAKEELDRDGALYAADVPVGIMIETPAAAILSDELAARVDFFSVGTNDLTQYTLALDRQQKRLEQFADREHRAVLRLVELSAKNAHRAGIRIGICGELAADTRLTGEFLRMGIDELSVSPEQVLKLRQRIREF